MAHVEVDGDRLTVQIEGMDKLWTFEESSRHSIETRSLLRSPTPRLDAAGRGWRGPGVHLPGVLVAGTFHHKGDRAFWDVHDPSKAAGDSPRLRALQPAGDRG